MAGILKMRKVKSVFFIVLVLAVSVTVFAQNNSSVPSGKYFLTAFEINGMDMFEFFKMMSEMADESSGGSLEDMYIEFQGGGKFFMAMGSDEGEGGEGTFLMNGKNITLSANGEELKGTLDGNKLTLEQEQGNDVIKMVYEKK